jgi:hypothetical protein
MSTDWPVWPIFIIQGIVFILMFFPRSARFLGLRVLPFWIPLIIIFVALLIVLSLGHDATSTLNLHF